jgi:cellobiose-specific phosphotransferase system component IIA
LVRLDDGRFATFPSTETGIEMLRRAATEAHRPQFPFIIAEERGRHLRLQLAMQHVPDVYGAATLGAARLSATLEQKIIDFWRQTSDWDRNAGSVELQQQVPRVERLLPFEMRARRQYRESPKRPRRPKPKR